MPDFALHYEVLGLSPDATQEQVRQAFRKLARQWHPDTVGQNPESLHVAQEKMKELNAAYEFLKSHKSGKYGEAMDDRRGTGNTQRGGGNSKDLRVQSRQEAEALERRVRMIERIYLETMEQQRRINNGLCRECGQPLPKIDKLLGQRSHKKCRHRG